LTDAELLILLEGDVSDGDLDMSDDELDLVSDRNEHAVPTSLVALGLDPERRGFGRCVLELALANVSE
jgi:hypothetical protein